MPVPRRIPPVRPSPGSGEEPGSSSASNKREGDPIGKLLLQASAVTRAHLGLGVDRAAEDVSSHRPDPSRRGGSLGRGTGDGVEEADSCFTRVPALLPDSAASRHTAGRRFLPPARSHRIRETGQAVVRGAIQPDAAQRHSPYRKSHEFGSKSFSGALGRYSKETHNTLKYKA